MKLKLLLLRLCLALATAAAAAAAAAADAADAVWLPAVFDFGILLLEELPEFLAILANTDVSECNSN